MYLYTSSMQICKCRYLDMYGEREGGKTGTEIDRDMYTCSMRRCKQNYACKPKKETPPAFVQSSMSSQLCCFEHSRLRRPSSFFASSCGCVADGMGKWGSAHDKNKPNPKTCLEGLFKHASTQGPHDSC